MDTISNQDLFNRVAEHLIYQGVPAISSEGLCAYRGANSTRCAVGCLISNSEYGPDIEGSTVCGAGGHRVRSAVERSLDVLLSSYNIELLADLQVTHDAPDGRPEFMDEEGNYIPSECRSFYVKSLRRTAENFGLSDAVIDRELKSLSVD